MKVLVCGGRDYGKPDGTLQSAEVALNAHRTLSDLLYDGDGSKALAKVTLIIQGGATGADHIAKVWARNHCIQCDEYAANWDDLTQPDAIIRTRKDGSKYDARAGHRRNQQMLEEGRPDLVVAFPGGKGTADMIARAKEAGVEVIEIKDA